MKMVKIQKRPFKINLKRPFLYNISYKKILWILQFTYSMLRRLHQLLGYAHLNEQVAVYISVNISLCLPEPSCIVAWSFTLVGV